jgi:ribosome-associated protein
MSDAPGTLRLAPNATVAEAALTFSASRSGGPGGQHVNRTESKIELRVLISAIAGLSPRAHDRLVALAGERLTADGELLLTCDETRSQRRNRELVIERLCELVVEAKAVPAVRRTSKPTWGSRQRRLGEKRLNGEKKRERRTQE